MKVSVLLPVILFLIGLSGDVFAVKSGEEFDKVIKPYVNHHAFSGVVLVAKKGKVVYQRGYGLANETWNIANTKQTRFSLASLSKPFTALLVMQLVQEGKIGLTDTLEKYLPYLPEEKAKKITIEMLLGHRAGLPRQFAIPGWTQGKFDRLRDKVAYAKEIGKLALIAEPGEHYSYTNLGYFLLALVVEHVTDSSFEFALNQYIFEPLNMTDTGAITNNGVVPRLAQSYQISPDGGLRRSNYRNMNLFWAGGNLYSTASDLLKFEQALYDDSLLNKAHRKILLAKENRFSWSQEPWDLSDDDETLDTINWGGELPGASSFMVRFVEDRNTVVILSNDGLNEIAKRTMARQLARVLYHGEHKPTKLPLSLVLTKALFEDSLEQTIAEVKAQDKNYLIDRGIGQIGLQLMWTGELTDSVSVLALNVHYFPDSPAAHENLSQALEASALLPLALKSKQQALKLLPDNSYLQEEVKRMKAQLSNL